ncbi:MAG: NAD-dependent epimerase/dehydratase family protein [Myxococcota bacterium]|nr:NAD-dependent epimerase/dehydratase family protein [Myxococcota bacterium]
MRVLFIGGTGIISSACARLALARGIDLTLLCRGKTGRHPVPPSARVLQADIRDPQSARNAIGDKRFDVVVNWIGFLPAHVELDIELFRGRTGQYVFISSASVYQTPPSRLPVTESMPLFNPYWQYSRDKIACEERLIHAYRAEGFPATIVRPSHTYDHELLPVHGGWTVIDRFRRGMPVIVHGDGTSLWTLTHHEDFARGFVGLLGRREAVGDSFHITSDENLTWDRINEVLARAAGAPSTLVHVPSDLIAAFDADWGAGLLGDKSHSMIFDNTKIKRMVPEFRAVIPYAHGAVEQVAWYDEDAKRRVVNDATNKMIDRILSAYSRAWPDKS